MGEEPFEEMDQETAEHMLSEIERFAVDEYSASFVDADRNPPKLENGEVKLPQSLKDVLQAYREAGWDSLFRPPVTRWRRSSDVAALGRSGIPGRCQSNRIPIQWHTDAGRPQRASARPNRSSVLSIRRSSNDWGGTMVLTEPDAGSDVGAGTTKAIPVDEEAGIYHLEGVKRFITSGEHDGAENIIHLVLARPLGAVPGTKGLSLFVVPKYMVNDDGSLGERNGVFATNLEKKMGIKASTTCELSFGVDQPCVGYLVGNVHDGIRQMFLIIERARMLIGTKSTATLSTAYLNSLEYAKERLQGADMTQMTDKTAPRVAIIRHPDVRRMLMLQKSHAEGLRALLYYTGWVQDQQLRFPDEKSWAKLDDFLLPLVKGYSSEKAYELLATSLQVFGGSGFTQDYPIEQYIRDTKIDTLYEGTTAIQALDLFFRKIARDQGQTLMGSGRAGTRDGQGWTGRSGRRAGVAWQGTRRHPGSPRSHGRPLDGSPARPDRSIQARPARQHPAGERCRGDHRLAAAAACRGGPGSPARGRRSGHSVFYEGKIASARFFSRHALPKTLLRREAAEQEDGALMDMADEAF